MYYYIVGNRAFTNKEEAIIYCNECDFDPELMIETKTTKIEYYELQTASPNYQIFYNDYLTSEQLKEEYWKKYLEDLKNGEYTISFVHLQKITEKQYNKKNIA